MPEPDVPYREYPQLLAEARSTVPPFSDPGQLARYQELVTRRGADWCSSVLARAFSGLRSATVLECHLLTLADRDDLQPPLPASIVAARAAADAHQAALAARATTLAAADLDRWETALATCGVPVEVRPNVAGRRTGTGLAAGPLRHAVPTVDAHSGRPGAPRLHPAGRCVCETVGRARPRRLGAPTTEPATCRACLALVGQLRTAEPSATP